MAFHMDRTSQKFERTQDNGTTLNLPAVTLFLGVVASLFVATGALDGAPLGNDITSELSHIELLTGTIED